MRTPYYSIGTNSLHRTDITEDLLIQLALQPKSNVNNVYVSGVHETEDIFEVLVIHSGFRVWNLRRCERQSLRVTSQTQDSSLGRGCVGRRRYRWVSTPQVHRVDTMFEEDVRSLVWIHKSPDVLVLSKVSLTLPHPRSMTQ